MSAIAAMKTVTAAIVAGSVGLTLKSSVPSTRERSSAPTIPTTRPMPVSLAPCRRIRPSTLERRRAERHADADLAVPLRDAVRQDAVGADRREQQRERREHAEELRDEPRPSHRLPEHVAHRPELHHRKRRVGLAHDLPEARRERVKLEVGTDDDIHLVGHEDTVSEAPELLVDEVQLGADGLIEAALLHVFQDADDE